MPQIKFRGIEVEQVKGISKELLQELQRVIEYPPDDLTFECISSVYIANGDITAGYPFVEVAWFDRGQQVQDDVAKIITRFVQQTGQPSVDVIFTNFL